MIPAASRSIASRLPVLLPALIAPPAVLIAAAARSPLLLPALATAAIYPFMARLILRVAGYVLIGVALARPGIGAAARLRARRPGADPPAPAPVGRTWYLAALGLLILDVALKALLAPAWAALLRPCLGA